MKFIRRLLNRQDKDDPITADERLIMKKCLRDGDIVLDVGGHHGKWSLTALERAKVNLHVFEASAEAHAVLKTTLADKVTLNWNAVSNRDAPLTFHVYRDDARLSSLHRRISVEDQLLQQGFDAITVPGTTLDTYWKDRPEQIRFLKVDVEGAEYDVLRGARGLLRRGQVDFLQFEYGGTFLDSGTTLRNVWAMLRRHGYCVFRVENGKFTELEKFTKADENYSYSNFLAMHERLVPIFTGKGVDIALDIDRLKRFGLTPKGVLHVGAHKGDEIDTYRKHAMGPVVFVEANPDLAQGLRDRFDGQDDVTVIEAAASDSAGEATFNITSMDQSSSLLDLKDHARLYPKIQVARQITVRTQTLDALLAEAGVDPAGIQFIAMDIQGAELMALKGATGILASVQALQIEVNFAELYEGCARITDLDAFLGTHGFLRVGTITPYSDSCGDAVYVRQPQVSCSIVGSMGRFANQVFQYLFIQCYAEEFGYRALTPVWAGDDMFNVRPGQAALPKLPFALAEDGYELANSNIPNDPLPRPATDFSGFFQYHTRYYMPYQAMIRSHLAFKGAYRDRADALRALFDAQPGPVAALHLRRGDFGTGVFFIAPEAWYLDWIETLKARHPDLTLYIASDDLDQVLPAFAGHRVITERDLPAANLPHGFATDFAALTLADHVAISNSSFSFLASMLNEKATSFLRPDLQQKALVSYEPWNAPVLLRGIEAESAGEEFMSDRAKGRSKYRFRKLFRRKT